MIVLKSSQDKVLSVLQAVSGIVERRHTLPVLANVPIRKTSTNSPELVEVFEPNKTARAAVLFFRPDPTTAQASSSGAYLSTGSRAVRIRAMSVVPRSVGFFSSSKANLRNAP